MKATTEEQRARQRVYQHTYYQKNREKILARNKANPNRLENGRRAARKWYQTHKFYQKEYGWRRQESEARRPRPDRCEVCGDAAKKIHFDHCHQRGLFRGWICNACNLILGHAKDDPNHLRKLIAYLERTKDLIPPQLELSV